MTRLLAAILLLAASAQSVLADEMNFFMRNDHGRAVVVELFSHTRDHRWPGDGKVYLLELGDKKSVVVDCQQGEQICYGAWVNGDDTTHWGVGPDDDQACDDCCHICVKSSTATVAVGGRQ